MTRYLVTGARGMLGHDLLAALDGREVTALGRAELDITDADAVDRVVAGHDWVINAAADTAVDAAETHEEQATAVNGVAPGHLARAAARHGARVIHLSTDYVFDGTATEPYPEDAPLNPQSAYGRSKAVGEAAVQREHPAGAVIVRTAWLYGAHGGNFAATMCRLVDERGTVAVVTDQVGQPTWTGDLARQLVELMDANAPAGIYHGTNAGRGSWFDFARAVMEQTGRDPLAITPTTSAAFVRPAPRPAFSVLAHGGWARAGLAPMRPWEAALADAVARGALPRRAA